MGAARAPPKVRTAEEAEDNEPVHPDARDLLTSGGIAGVSARQLVATLKGGFDEGGSPIFPTKPGDDTPDLPNIYTDGGVVNPTTHQWSFPSNAGAET